MKHLREITHRINPADIARLLDQLAQHPELWNASDEWIRGKPLLYATHTIVLRYNKTPEGQMPMTGWNRPAFALLPGAVPILMDAMRAAQIEHLGKVLISRLAPGDKLDWHVDRWPAPGAPYFQRYQVPLHGKRGVRFCVEDEEVFMEPGSAWWFDNQRLHAVFNDSDDERLSLFFDARPFTLAE